MSLNPFNKRSKKSPGEINKAVNSQLKNFLKVTALSDSPTAIGGLRFLEAGARSVQIKSIYGLDADVDAKTIELIEQEIAPFVLAELIIVPMMTDFIVKFAAAFVNGLQNLPK